MKEIIGRQREELATISKDSLEARKRPFLSASPLVLGALTLGACGGGSGGGSAPGPAPTPAPPPAPEPDFIEDPDGTFTARDDAGRTLEEGGSTADLIVFGGEGADTITTGSGVDVIRGAGGNDAINSGAGNDLILGGAGADNVAAGDGDDVIVVVGTSAADQYTTESIVNPGGSGLDLSPLLGLSDINGVTDSHVVAGEVLDGGAGTNTLVVYGDVDLTEATILNVTQLQVNSDVTLTTGQLAQFTLVDGDDGSTLRIVSSDGAPVVVDLDSFVLTDVNRLDLGPNVTISVESSAALREMGVTVVTGEGQVSLTGADTSLAGLILGNNVGVRANDGTTVDVSAVGATRASDARVDDVDGFANQAPTGLSLSSSSVEENAFGAVVGEVMVADPDVDDIHAYIVDDERFEVVDGVLQLKSGVALDFETTPTIFLTVTAIDVSGNEISQPLEITVNDVNEAPVGLALSGNSVDENASGAEVGVLTVEGGMQSGSLSFEVSDDRFEVVDGTLQLRDGVALDFEEESSVFLDVTATGAAGQSITQSLSIAVQDVNDVPSAIGLQNTTVVENEAGAVVGSFVVVDDDHDTHDFMLSDDRFEVVNGVLQLRQGVALDAGGGSVTLEVTATDALGASVTQVFEITVLGDGANEAPRAIGLTNTSVVENAAGAEVGQFVVDDTDDNTHSFTVGDDRFEVVNGVLQLRSGIALDFETEANITFDVTATDPSGESVTQSFTITVINGNEPPSGITLEANTVLENTAGAEIGRLNVEDVDGFNDSFTFELSDDRFEVVDGVLRLKDGVSLDFETEDSISVEVTAFDSGGESVTETFEIVVQDVNDAPSAISLDNNIINEDQEGAIIGNLSVTDDAGDTHEFTVSDDRFRIEDGVLRLVPGVSLDFETSSTVSVDVTATDAAGLSVTETFVITLQDVNDAPTAITIGTPSIFENNPGGSFGNVTVSDIDDDVHTFTLSDNRFEIVDGNLFLKDGIALDFEDMPRFPLFITATDASGNSFTAEFNINVIDVPDVLEVITAELDIRILDGQKVAFDLSTAFFSDTDLTFTLEGADAHLFQILPNGTLSFLNAPDMNVPIDADGDGIYSVSFRAVSSELGTSDAVTLNIEVDPRLTAISVESSPIDDGPFIDALIHPGQNDANSAFIWGGGPADAPLVLTWSIATLDSVFSDVHLSFDVVERLDGILPTAAEIEIIQDALDLWGESANIQFVYVDEVADPTEHGEIRFFFFSQSPTGVGFLPGTEGLEGDIFIRDNLRAGLRSSETNFSKLILNHEIAHGVFGLQDVTPLAGLNDERLPWQFNNLGWTSLSYLNAGLGTVVDSSTDYSSPQILDILLAQHLHGVDNTHNVEDNVYEVNHSTGRAYWDAGGNDTFDASSTDGAARIDLRDGHVSTLGETGYVGIAFNAVIENAIGTDSDDLIFLNDVANIIDAGQGDDVIRAVSAGDLIDGGAGFDQVDILGNIGDYTITDQGNGTLLLSGIDGDITLTNVELVTFFDAKVNFSVFDEDVEAPTTEGTTYISVNTATFDAELWGYDATEVLAYIPVLPAEAGQTIGVPGIDPASGLFIDGSGGVRFGADPAAAGSYAVDYGQAGTPTQNIELELDATDNVYTIDIATATAQVDIWDFDGQDRLVLDFGMNAIGSLDAFSDQDNLYITAVDSLGNEVKIIVHNYQWYGFIEEIAFRSIDGEQVFNTTPFAEATRIGREQAAFGTVSEEFPVDANYFFAGQNDGEGLFNLSGNDFGGFFGIDEFLIVGGGNDLLFLGEGSNRVSAGAGDDVIHTGDSADYILAGRGADIIYAYGGDDLIFAEFETAALEATTASNDIIYAGDGNDFVRGADGDDLIYLGEGDDTTDSTHDQGNDTTYGEGGNDTIRSGAGDDFADGGDGDDTVFGDDFAVSDGFTPGNDELYGGAGNDLVSGDGGDDLVFGGDGDDRLYGDRSSGTEQQFDGNDTLDGGAGADMLFGGGGNDILIASESDLVEDSFNGGDGYDILRISDGGLEIDLTAIVNANRLNEVEEISLENSGADTLSLSADDILDISDNDTLTITGENGDVVNLGEGDWLDGGDQVVDGVTFQVFTSGDATLLVDPDILVNVPMV